jgi:hypothetical protein
MIWVTDSRSTVSSRNSSTVSRTLTSSPNRAELGFAPNAERPTQADSARAAEHRGISF